MKNEPVQKERTPSIYTPISDAASGNVSETSSGSKSGFSEPRVYTDQDRYDWNVWNVGNFAKCAGKSKKRL